MLDIFFSPLGSASIAFISFLNVSLKFPCTFSLTTTSKNFHAVDIIMFMINVKG